MIQDSQEAFVTKRFNLGERGTCFPPPSIVLLAKERIQVNTKKLKCFQMIKDSYATVLRFFKKLFYFKGLMDPFFREDGREKGKEYYLRAAFRCLPIFIFALNLFIITPLYAQEDPSSVAQLMNRLGALEDENRELRGQLEETRHELSTLNHRMETLSADVEYRLTSSESGTALPPPPLPPSFPPPGGPGEVSELPTTTTGEYEKARSLLEQGEYEAAEKAFAAFLRAYPQDDFAGPAQYWLGVTYFVRGQHEEAAKTFAKGYKTYPKSPKAADNLLKLAKSLSALHRKADACTILEQMSSEHPRSHVEEMLSERKKLRCK